MISQRQQTPVFSSCHPLLMPAYGNDVLDHRLRIANFSVNSVHMASGPDRVGLISTPLVAA